MGTLVLSGYRTLLKVYMPTYCAILRVDETNKHITPGLVHYILPSILQVLHHFTDAIGVYPLPLLTWVY